MRGSAAAVARSSAPRAAARLCEDAPLARPVTGTIGHRISMLTRSGPTQNDRARSVCDRDLDARDSRQAEVGEPQRVDLFDRQGDDPGVVRDDRMAAGRQHAESSLSVDCTLHSGPPSRPAQGVLGPAGTCCGLGRCRHDPEVDQFRVQSADPLQLIGRGLLFERAGVTERDMRELEAPRAGNPERAAAVGDAVG